MPYRCRLKGGGGVPEIGSERRLHFEYGSIQGLFWLFSVVSFLFMTPVLQERGFGSPEIGLLFAVRYISQIVGQTAISSLADRHYGKIPLKWITAGMTLASIVFTLLFLLAPHAGLGPTILIFLGFGCTTFCLSPMIDSLAIQFIDLGRRLNYTACRTAGSLTWAAACLFVGRMMDIYGASGILLFQLIGEGIFLLAVLLFEDATPQIRQRIRADKTAGHGYSHGPAYLLRNYPRYAGCIVALVALYIGQALCTNFQVDVIKKLGGDNASLGLAGFVLSMAEVPIVLFFGYFRRRIGIDRMMSCAVFFAFLKIGVQSFAPNLPVFLLAQLFQMLGLGLMYATSVYFVVENIPAQDQVKAQGFVNIAAGVGSGGASLVSGAIYARWGLSVLLTIGTAVSGLAALLLFLAIRLPRESAAIRAAAAEAKAKSTGDSAATV